MAKKEIVYSEPKEYFTPEQRRVFEEAPGTTKLLSWFFKNKNYYIHDTGVDSLLEFIDIVELDEYVLDGPRKKTYIIYLINEHKREYDVTISKKECNKLLKLDGDELLKAVADTINAKEPEINKPIIKIIKKD